MKFLAIVLMHIFFLVALASFAMNMLVSLEPGLSSAVNISKYEYMTIMRISIGAGAINYVFLVLWSLLEVRSDYRIPEDRRKFLKKILLMKPMNGVVVFYLWKRYIARERPPSKRRQLAMLYYGRNITFYLLFLVLAMTFIEPSVFIFILCIALVILNVILHYVFELYVLSDIMKKTDDEIYMKGFDNYFKSIQPPLAYGRYFREEIMGKR